MAFKIPPCFFHQLLRQHCIVRVFAPNIITENLVEAIELTGFYIVYKGAVAKGFALGDELETVGEHLTEAEVAGLVRTPGTSGTI